MTDNPTPHKPRLSQYRQMAEARLPVVAELRLHGYSYRQIQQEVMTRFNLKSYSLGTVKKDVHRLLQEWREQRLADTEEYVQHELAVIDDITREAWTAWNKSKTDRTQRAAKQRGVPGAEAGGADVVTTIMEQMTKELICYGDPRYLDVIHKQAQERLAYDVVKMLYDALARNKGIQRHPVVRETIDGNRNGR